MLEVRVIAALELERVSQLAVATVDLQPAWSRWHQAERPRLTRDRRDSRAVKRARCSSSIESITDYN